MSAASRSRLSIRRTTSPGAGILNTFADGVRRKRNGFRASARSARRNKGVPTASLTVRGLYGNCGRITVQVEGRPGQAAQFTRPKARLHRQPVQHGPFGAGLAPGTARPIWSVVDRIQQTAHPLDRQGPSIMPSVSIDVHTTQVSEWVFTRLEVVDHPTENCLIAWR